MSSTTASAQTHQEKAWSFGSIINGFDDLKDDDGRPIQENRAPAVIKDGVQMKMRRCPYADERQGKMMNVSALAQITRHLDAVLADIGAFQAALPPGAPTWDRFCMALMDQLVQPAVSVLRSREREPRVSVRMAVGYKVAAGYLVPTRELMSLALGAGAPKPTLRNLIDYVHERKSLVGAREVCAAPMHMVERVSRALLEGQHGTSPRAAKERLLAARLLTQQQWLGLAWRAFDLDVERRLLLEDLGDADLRPRTPHVAGILEKRLASIRAAEVPDRPTLPLLFSAPQRARIGGPMRDFEAMSSWPSAAREIASLLTHGDGAILLGRADRGELLARRYAGYVLVLRAYQAVFDELERDLRAGLGFRDAAPIERHPAFFPEPKSLRWFEMITGHRLRHDPASPSGLALKNQHRVVSLPPVPTSGSGELHAATA